VASRDGVGGTARIRVDEQRAELVRRVAELRARADAAAERRAAASGEASA
jgi:argininosuccinate lyase